MIDMRRFGLQLLIGSSTLLLLGVGATFIWFRFFGLPERVEAALRDELAARGVSINAEELYLTVFGNIAAEDINIEYAGDQATHQLSVGRLFFDFNWISWWRGEPFLNSARLSGAKLKVPLEEGASIEIEDLDTNVYLRSTSLLIKKASWRCLGINFEVRGEVNWEGYEIPKSSTSKARGPSSGSVWRAVEKIMAQLESEASPKVTIMLQGSATDLSNLSADIHIESEEIRYQGLAFDGLDIKADLYNQRVHVLGTMRMSRGEITLEGGWRLKDTEAKLDYRSNLDLSLMRQAFPEGVNDFLEEIEFRVLPVNEGILELKWGDAQGFNFLLRSRSLWRNFSINGSQLDYLDLNVSYDGKRLFIQDALLKKASTECRFSFLLDGQGKIKGKLESDIDPTQLKGLFGPGAQPFFNSLDFSDGTLRLSCTAEGDSLKLEDIKVEGDIVAKNFSYKKIKIRNLKTPFLFEKGSQLRAVSLFIQRPEGQATGEVWHDFKTKRVRISNGRSNLKVREVAPMFGNKMVEYVKPYRFYANPSLKIEGTLDLGPTNEKTNLEILVKSEEGMDYDFLGRTLSLSQIDSQMLFKGKKLYLKTLQPTTLFQGTIDGTFELDMNTKKARFISRARFEKQNFGDLMLTFFDNKDVSGTLDGDLTLNGELGDLSSLNGQGNMTILEGILYPIPIFGSFSEILNSLIPKLGYAKASKAFSEFKIRDGVWETEKIDISSTAFALIGKGNYDLVKDDVNLFMRVNIRGVLGIPLFLVSKFFEYEGNGTLQDTTWKPKNI
ncbi:MAG: AsmA-like C-terminal region-containing protein [Verrucomicrobiota bacterium]